MVRNRGASATMVACGCLLLLLLLLVAQLATTVVSASEAADDEFELDVRSQLGDACTGHGSLNLYNICVCDYGWTGPRCQYSLADAVTTAALDAEVRASKSSSHTTAPRRSSATYSHAAASSVVSQRVLVPRATCSGGFSFSSFSSLPQWDSQYDGYSKGTYKWAASKGDLYAYATDRGDSSRVLVGKAAAGARYTLTVEAQRIGVPYDPSSNTTAPQQQFNVTKLDGSALLVGYSLGDFNNAAVCTDRPSEFVSFNVHTVGAASKYTATFSTGTYSKVAVCLRLASQSEALFKVSSLQLSCLIDPNEDARSLGGTIHTQSALIALAGVLALMIAGSLLALCACGCANRKRTALILGRYHAAESDDSAVEMWPMDGGEHHHETNDGGARKPLIPNARSGRPGEHPELIPVVDERHKDPWLDEVLPDGRSARRGQHPFGFDFGSYTLGYDLNDKHDRCMIVEIQKKVRGLIAKLPLRENDNGYNEHLLRRLYARLLGPAMVRETTYLRSRTSGFLQALEWILPIQWFFRWVFSCCGSRDVLKVRKGWAFSPADMIKDIMLYFCVWMECGSMQNSGADFVRLVYLSARRDPTNLRLIRSNFEIVTKVLEHVKLVKKVIAVRGMEPCPPDFFPNMGDFANMSMNPHFYRRVLDGQQGLRAFEEPDSDNPSTPFARIFHLKPLEIDSMRYPVVSHPEHIRGRRRQAVQKLEQAVVDEWIADCGRKYRSLRTYRTHRVTTNQLYGLFTYLLNAAPVLWLGMLLTIIEIRITWGDEISVIVYAILLVFARVLVLVMEIWGHFWTRAPERLQRVRAVEEINHVFDAEALFDMGRRLVFCAFTAALTVFLDVVVLFQPIRTNVQSFAEFPMQAKVMFILTQALMSVIGSTLIGSLCTPFVLSMFALVRKSFLVYRCRSMDDVVAMLDKAEKRFLQIYTRMDPATDTDRSRVAFTKVLRMLIKDAYHTDCLSPELFNALMESLRITDRVSGDYLSGKRENFDKFKRLLLSKRWQFDYADEFRRRLAFWVSGLRHPNIPPMHNVLSAPGVSTMCPSARETVAWFPREARDLMDLGHAIRTYADEWVFFCKRVLLDYETTRATRDQRALGHMLSIFGVHRFDPETHEMDKIVNDPRCKPTHDHRGHRLNTAASKMIYDSAAKNIGILRYLNNDQHTEVFDSLFYIDRKYFEAVRRWMSARIQSLSRTIKGFSTTWKALTVLARIQNPRMTKAVARALAEDKYQMVVSFQELGETIKGSRWEKHPSGQQLVNQQNVLDLLDTVCNTPVDLVTVLRRDTRFFSVRYRVRRINGNIMMFLQRKLRLPGDFLFGNGKSDNQSQMLMHVRNLNIQAVDVNQHGSPEEQMKLLNVAEEFYLDPRLAICGFSQYVITDGWTAVGTVAASNERTFNATTQRGLDIVGLRTHYGQPDLMAYDYLVGHNGESLSDFVSEDTPKGVTMHLFGLRVRHVDYITCGKGRDCCLPTTNRFSLKISAGGGEIGTTQLFRESMRNEHVGICKRWVLFHTLMGFFTSQYVIVWGIIAFLTGHVLLTIVNWFNDKILDYMILKDYSDIPWYIFISIALVIPAMITYMMEYGPFTGFKRFAINLVPMVLFQSFTMFTFWYGFSTGLKGTGKRHASGRTLGLDHFRLAQIKAWYRDSHLVPLGFFIVSCSLHLIFGGNVLVLWSTFLLICLITLALILQNPRTIPLFHSVTASECTTNIGNFWLDMNTWRFWQDEKTGLAIPVHRQQNFKNFIGRLFTRKYFGDVLMFVANAFILLTLLMVSYPFRPLAEPDTGHRFSYYAEIRSFGVPPGQDFRLEGALPPEHKEDKRVRNIRLRLADNVSSVVRKGSQFVWSKIGLGVLVFTQLWVVALLLVVLFFIIYAICRAIWVMFCCCCNKKKNADGEEGEEEVEEEDELPNLDKFKTPSLASDATETSVVLINSELEYAEGPAPWEETDYSILAHEKGKNPWQLKKATNIDMDDTEYDAHSDVSSNASLPWLQANGQRTGTVSAGREAYTGTTMSSARLSARSGRSSIIEQSDVEAGYRSDSPPAGGKGGGKGTHQHHHQHQQNRRSSAVEGSLKGVLQQVGAPNRGRRFSGQGSELEYANSETRLLPSEDGDGADAESNSRGSFRTANSGAVNSSQHHHHHHSSSQSQLLQQQHLRSSYNNNNNTSNSNTNTASQSDDYSEEEYSNARRRPAAGDSSEASYSDASSQQQPRRQAPPLSGRSYDDESTATHSASSSYNEEHHQRNALHASRYSTTVSAATASSASTASSAGPTRQQLRMSADDAASEAQTGTHVSLPSSGWEEGDGATPRNNDTNTSAYSSQDDDEYAGGASRQVALRRQLPQSSEDEEDEVEIRVNRGGAEQDDDSDHSMAETITQTISEVSPRGARNIVKKVQKKKIVRKIVRRKRGKATDSTVETSAVAASSSSSLHPQQPHSQSSEDDYSDDERGGRSQQQVAVVSDATRVMQQLQSAATSSSQVVRSVTHSSSSSSSFVSEERTSMSSSSTAAGGMPAIMRPGERKWR